MTASPKTVTFFCIPLPAVCFHLLSCALGFCSFLASFKCFSSEGPLCRADGAPSIDKQQAVTALLLIHDTGEPGQCKADEQDS